MVRLLNEGTTSILGGFISKNGKTFKARLVLKDGAAVFNFDRPNSGDKEGQQT